ncbi:MAG: hypothetical protein IKX40_04420 [Thermoguttaceae bacterium]|nr:hypothetical protein [Thermoguttaceae bacterium]
MIKNQSATIPFFVYNPSDGSPATGATSISVYVSLDGGSPALATNSAVEVDASHSPGIYKIVLTAAEMNADVVVLTFSHATAAAMPMTIVTQPDVPTANAIADAALSRSVSNVEASAAEHSLTTLILGALESKLNADKTWSIYRTDGETLHATKTVSTNASAEPVTGVE